MFSIQPDHHYGVYAGSVESENQILAKAEVNNYIVVFFDKQGEITSVSKRDFDKNLNIRVVTKLLEEELESLNYKPDVIRVKQFFLPDLQIGIKELPEELEEFLENSSNFSPEEQAEFESEILDWHDRGSFVFHWGNDFWMDDNGYITDT